MLSKREIYFLNESNKIDNLHDFSYDKNSNQGHAKAWIYLREKVKSQNLIALKDICYIQKLITIEQECIGEVLEDILKGNIRSPKVPYNVKVGGYQAPKYDKVPDLMENYITSLNGELSNPTMHPLDSSAVYHKRFESIQPFGAGNGRTGRLIANYGLKGSSIIPFEFEDREKYYDACKSEDLMKKYFIEKSIKYGICMNDKCDNDLIKNDDADITQNETVIYECNMCGQINAVECHDIRFWRDSNINYP
tara:strand:- start:13 stop:762 length:750 start_codon:yes stop_codon:yes gene_type:complete